MEKCGSAHEITCSTDCSYSDLFRTPATRALNSLLAATKLTSPCGAPLFLRLCRSILLPSPLTPTMQIFTVACGLCLSLVVAVLALAFFPPRRLLAALSRRSGGVRFFFARSVARLPLRVALTIDDAPSAGTGLILDVLRSHGVRATFFVIGSNGLAFPHILERVRSEGHELANHDWVDRRSAGVALPQLLQDLARTSSEVLQSPEATAKWFRPGAGFFTRAMVAAVRARFGCETVLSDCYSHDIRLRHAHLCSHARARGEREHHAAARRLG